MRLVIIGIEVTEGFGNQPVIIVAPVFPAADLDVNTATLRAGVMAFKCPAIDGMSPRCTDIDNIYS